MGTFRLLTRFHVAFPIAIILTIITALLPSNALGLTKPLAFVTHVLAEPGSWMARRVGSIFQQDQLRYPSARGDYPNISGNEETEQLISELERVKRLYYEQQLLVSDLQQRLNQLQQLSLEFDTHAVRPLLADITSSSPGQVRGPVHLRAGKQAGVAEGDAAIYGNDLLGRIVSTSDFSSTLEPIISQSTGDVWARIQPYDNPEAPISSFPPIALVPQGSGIWLADIDHLIPVTVGDLVRINDPKWSTVTGYIVGRVVAINRKDANPLRNVLTIQPHFELHQLSSVTLLIHQEEFSEGVAR